MTTTYLNVSSASQLSADIKAIDLALQADGGNGTHYRITLEAGNTFTGGVKIDEGTLELANRAAAGSGNIRFASN